ncbi:MAG: ammonia-forming cytochrome c nitrite reductase subunit c552, partial [Acidobacteriota bacterium]
GPGEAHVQAARAGRAGEGIIQPAKLDAAEQVGVCAACHGLAYPFETRWGGNRPYRPGDRYEEAFLPLLRRRESAPYTSITHADHTPSTGVMEYQGLVQSRCYLEGKATCITCHDPHGGGRGAHALKVEASSDDLCAGCHQEIVASGRAHTHHPPDAPGGSCVDCHMPPTVQALGTRLATHAIDVPLPVNNLDFSVPDACSLCHADRGVKWAVKQYEKLWGSPEKKRRRRLARMFVEQDPTALARLLADEKESSLLRADAAAALTRAEGPRAAGPLVAALGQGNPLLVRRYAADLLGSLGPGDGLPLEEQVKQFDELKAKGVMSALRQAQAEGPSVLRLGAAASLARLGTDDGLERLEELRQDPVLEAGYRLHLLLGKYDLYAQEMDEAAAAYQRVLDITPNNLTAIQDMGFIYFSTGRFQEAHDLWMRGLALIPDNEELKMKVHLAEDEIRKQKSAARQGDPALGETDHEGPLL